MSYRWILKPLAALILACMSLLVGCGDNDATDPDELANVRIVNASPTTTQLDAFHESLPVVTGLAFQNTNAASGCGAIEHGDEDIEFQLGGTNTELGEVEYDFVAKQNYTVVFYGPNNAAVYPDVFTSPGATDNALRFINASGTAGDVHVTTPTGALTATPAISNLAAGQVSGFNSSSAPGGTFVNYPVANTRVRLMGVGQTTGTPRADFTLTNLPANRVVTIVFTPPPASGTTTAFMVNSCAS